MKLEQLKLNNIKPAIIVSIQDISFIEDEHLNILINYLFDIAIDCMENNELEVKLTTPTGKPVGFLLSSLAYNRTSFSDFGIQV